MAAIGNQAAGPKVVIRPATRDDFGAIAEITNYYIAHTAIHFGLAPVSADELFGAWHPKADRFPFVVMEQSDISPPGRIIGYAKAGVWRERAAYADTAEIGVYLRHDLVGRGLGKRLYDVLIDECRLRGFHTLIGGIALPNPASIKLHLACGFEHVGTFRRVGRKFDQMHDVAFYQLML